MQDMQHQAVADEALPDEIIGLGSIDGAFLSTASGRGMNRKNDITVRAGLLEQIRATRLSNLRRKAGQAT